MKRDAALEGERQVAPTVDGIRRDHVARYQWAAKQLPKGSRVVDIACGVGYGSKILAEAGHSVVAIDRDAAAIDYAKEHYAHPRVVHHIADANRARFDDEPVDAAVCFEMLEHLVDPLPLLRALRSAVGVLLASVPNEKVFPYDGQAFHHRHYAPAEFKALLERAGWEVSDSDWWGQLGDESEVEQDLMGRTLIAVARPQAAPQAVDLRTGVVLPPKGLGHIAILGLGPSVAGFLELAKRYGGRRKMADEVWVINALGDVLLADRIFHMDDVRIQEIRAAAKPEGNIAALLPWLKTHPGPVYTSRPHPDYPGLVPYPLEEVVRDTGYAYMNTTAAHAVALAVYARPQKITCWGLDFTYAKSHDAEKGRACVEFWLGMAAARGIKIATPHTSSLLDACEDPRTRLYGYDTLDVTLGRDAAGLHTVSFTERRGPLPSAAEIEDRYDHSRHPNPLVEKGH